MRNPLIGKALKAADQALELSDNFFKLSESYSKKANKEIAADSYNDHVARHYVLMSMVALKQSREYLDKAKKYNNAAKKLLE